jgi:tetratricopeptide (TPR) repeat protein
MFLGRDRELADLGEGLAGAQGGQGGLWLLVGEPGIGKTRLAEEIAARARAAGLAVGWGRTWEAGGAPAYWPWREALEALADPFPEVPTLPGTDPAEARFALYREVASVLRRISSRGPLVVFLEDLHAADRSTLLLLEFLAPQLRSMPVLLVATYRDVEARLNAEAGELLGRVGRAGRVLHLPRLDRTSVSTLVQEGTGASDEAVVASVFEATQGNPLFVDEVVRVLRGQETKDGPFPIPLGVREVIRQRISRLSEPALQALEIGAVLGVEFPVAEVLQIMPAAEGPLDDCARAGLVSPRARRLRFSHALYREALYHDLPRTRRQELHRAAATALAASSAPLAERAHHLLEAGPAAAPEAVQQAVAAAELALDLFAFEDALDLLARARAAIPAGPAQDGLRCRVMVAMGEARLRSGDPAGRPLCVEAASLARSLDHPELFAAAALAYGSVFTLLKRDQVLVDLLDESLRRLPADDSVLRAKTMARLAAARQPSGDWAPDVRLGFEAIEMARRVGDRRALLGVLHLSGGVIYGPVPARDRLPVALEQEQLAEELGDKVRLISARVRIARDHLELCDVEAYERSIEAYERALTTLARPELLWRVPIMRSAAAMLRGRFDESERLQEESRRLEFSRPDAVLCQTFHRIGFLRAAERHEEMKRAAAELPGRFGGLLAGSSLPEALTAALYARVGAEAEARIWLERLPPHAFGLDVSWIFVAEAVCLVGNAEQAGRLTAAAASLPTRWATWPLNCEIVEAPIDRLEACLAGILGDWDQAERRFIRALEMVEGVGLRALAARQRFEYGDVMARVGHAPDRARSLLAEARAGAAAAGVPDLVSLIDRRHPGLSPVPGRAARAEASPAFCLTREGEYFTLASAGHTFRFKVSRGMSYLQRLLAQPGLEIHVLDLVGTGGPVDRGDAGEMVDPQALRSYRSRLEELRDVLADAEELGDCDRAAAARSQMEAIAAEISRSTALGGRPRRAESAVDRARSAVQRRIKDAIDRIGDHDPELARALRRAVRTGNTCCYQPDR